MEKQRSGRETVLGIAGAVLVLIGAVVFAARDFAFRVILQKTLVLQPGTRTYELWKATSEVDTYLKIYMFNWTNPEQLSEPGVKPNFAELGPYVYKEVREKVNIKFHPENHTVSYWQKRSWYFEPNRSLGRLDDPIMQINVVSLSATHKIRFWPYPTRETAAYMLDSSSSRHVMRTVDELLFAGYPDKLITVSALAKVIEDLPPFDRFGWFYQRNGSTELYFEGHSNVATGEDDIENLAAIRRWNFAETLSHYPGPCNLVEGSTGEFWPPGRPAHEDVRLFMPDLCRPITLGFVDKVDVSGLDAHKYELGARTLSNDTRRSYTAIERREYFARRAARRRLDASLADSRDSSFFSSVFGGKGREPEDAVDVDLEDFNEGECFCSGECVPRGLINITACRFGAPAFVSLPHFYKADPDVGRRISGMRPSRDLHDFYIVLEPSTGLPLEVAGRLQINLLLQPSESVGLFANVPRLFVPIFWFEMEARVPEEKLRALGLLVSVPQVLGYLGLLLAGIGALMLCGFAVLLYRRRTRATGGPRRDRTRQQQQGKAVMYLDTTFLGEDAGDGAQIRSDRILYPAAERQALNRRT